MQHSDQKKKMRKCSDLAFVTLKEHHIKQHRLYYTCGEYNMRCIQDPLHLCLDTLPHPTMGLDSQDLPSSQSSLAASKFLHHLTSYSTISPHESNYIVLCETLAILQLFEHHEMIQVSGCRCQCLQDSFPSFSTFANIINSTNPSTTRKL